MSATACPKCRADSLVRVHESDAPGVLLRCRECRGHWLSDEAVHNLGPVIALRVSDPPYQSVPHDRDRRTGLCPEGHGILVRARVEVSSTSFHIERCTACHGVFFDEGELSALATERLLGRIDQIFDPDYRRARRASAVDAHLDEATTAALGESLVAQLEEIADRLAGHPARSMAIAWLLERVRRTEASRG